MRTSFISGILHNDPKGLTGRGTQHWFEVRVLENDKETIDRYEYFLLDVLENKIDLSEIKRPYLERQRAYDKDEENKSKELKVKEEAKRKDSVKSDPELDLILDAAVIANPKAVEEFKSGKEKALNAIVGFVMKEIKAKNMPVVDPAFTVSTLLKQKLGL